MLKRWIGVMFLLTFLLTPGIAWADELPPGDEIVIPAPSDLSTVKKSLENTAFSTPDCWEPGIPVPADEGPAAAELLENKSEVSAEPDITPDPVITEELLAEFATPLINSPVNRNHNINQAMLAINNQVINPGETWSFNQVVGPRTAERGYKKAMIIVNKKFVPGIGGGVCQVASTLYNAILQAKLKIIERHPHSLPVSYVTSGCDATVSYGVQDLKFSNNLPHQVVIKTNSLPGKITIAFFTRKIQTAADSAKPVNIPIDMP